MTSTLINQHEAAARTRKVWALIDAIETVIAPSTILDINVDVLAAVPAELRNEFAGLVAGNKSDPSDETWAELVRMVQFRQVNHARTKDLDPFDGF